MKARACVGGFALAIAVMASPVAARSPEALACAVKAAPVGLDARVADVILSQDNDRGRPVLDELRALTDRCAEDQFLNAKQRDAYFDYSKGRMGRDVIDTRLGEEGIASTLIDQALDIGPGNANNPAGKVTEGDLRRVTAALAEAGRDPARVTPRGWALVTAWIEATSAMFDGLRNLD